MKLLPIKALFLSAFVSANACAEFLILDYPAFYDQMEDVEDAEVKHIRMGVFARDKQGQPCQLLSQQIKDKDGQIHELKVSDAGELLLPFDKALDEKKSEVILEVTDKTACQIQSDIFASGPHKKAYSAQELNTYAEEFSALYKELGGMMSFMLPKVRGVGFVFASAPGTLPGLHCEETVCHWQQQGKAVNLPEKPLAIRPYIK